jgi:hypothetical protein
MTLDRRPIDDQNEGSPLFVMAKECPRREHRG